MLDEPCGLPRRVNQCKCHLLPENNEIIPEPETRLARMLIRFVVVFFCHNGASGLTQPSTLGKVVQHRNHPQLGRTGGATFCGSDRKEDPSVSSTPAAGRILLS
jgi:hypothetical protein